MNTCPAMVTFPYVGSTASMRHTLQEGTPSLAETSARNSVLSKTRAVFQPHHRAFAVAESAAKPRVLVLSICLGRTQEFPPVLAAPPPRLLGICLSNIQQDVTCLVLSLKMTGDDNFLTTSSTTVLNLAAVATLLHAKRRGNGVRETARALWRLCVHFAALAAEYPCSSFWQACL